MMEKGTSVEKEINYAEEILKLKEKKNAVILAHYYQIPEIQDIADHVGDSLGLSQIAADTNADLIVFAGVHFMGETAKILNPRKKVVIPDEDAGCSLADSCPVDIFRKFIAMHPNHTVITYINCNAEIKALSDIICTSSNAVDVVNSIPKGKPIIFAPDENLGKYLQKETGRDMVLWNGVCAIHDAFSIDKLLVLHDRYPEAKIIAHPESDAHILRAANFIGSTAAMIKYVKQDPAWEYIIATEPGIFHQMRKEVRGKELIPAPPFEDTECACSECAFMKLNSMKKLYLCMKREFPFISIPDHIIRMARKPLNRMFKVRASVKQL